MSTSEQEYNVLSEAIIGAAMRVHSALGPGLLEIAYELCLVYELKQAGLDVSRQVAVPLNYGKVVLDAGYRLDMVVNKQIVVELKAVEKLQNIHTAQMLSYLRLGRYKLGLLLNFNVIRMKDGIKRIANGL